MGCLNVNITRVGGDLSASFERQGERPTVVFTRTPKMRVRFGLVCGANIGDGYLYATDALLITIENGKLIVKQA